MAELQEGARYHRGGRAIGVALVVGVRLYREALARVLAAERDLVLRCEAATCAEAVIVVERQRPDVVLLDVGMPGALAAMRRCRAIVPAARLVAIGFDGSEGSAIAAAEAGVGGYIGIDEAPCDASTAAVLLRRVAATAVGEHQPGPLDALTARERLILQHVARGHSNKQIASELVIGLATVKTHVHAILRKLGVPSRGAAAELLRESQLVGPPGPR
jgi:DNA-binding NarL/FixJ family response regulator